MAYLLVLGNTNHHTFANSILAANEKAKTIFGRPLDKIFVIHSVESEEKLRVNREWQEHLQTADIDLHEIQHKVIELLLGGEEVINKFIEHIEFLFNGVGLAHSDDWIVDLTNGTSVQKNLLSITSYILDIKHQFIVDISILNSLTQERGFLDSSIMSKCYVPAPDSTLMDNFAYLDLSQMIRYKKVIETQTQVFSKLASNGADTKFFKENLIHSVKLKLDGDLKKDNAIYRIATTSIAASVEELLSELLRSNTATPSDGLTLGQKITAIRKEIESKLPEHFDIAFLDKFNEFMLYLRNSTTHKGKLLSDMERFKAELAIKMSFPFLEFYMDIIAPLLSGSSKPPKGLGMKVVKGRDIPLDKAHYFGLDGDDTGKILEGLFISPGTDADKFKVVSKSIKKAINEIMELIRAEKGKIIFEAGDDLLFEGKFSYQHLSNMQQIYADRTGGYTCSISFGSNLYETFLGMKLAKSHPGKNTILGVDLS